MYYKELATLLMFYVNFESCEKIQLPLLQIFEPYSGQTPVIVPIKPSQPSKIVESSNGLMEQETTSMDEPPPKKNRPVSAFVMGDSKDDEEETVPIRKEGIIMSGIDSSQPLKEITYKKYEKDEQ